jgi:hypothetical protein
MSDQDAPPPQKAAKPRRRRKAAGGRIAVTGASAGALLGIVGAIAAHSVPSAATRRVASPATTPSRHAATRPTAAPTTIVWRVVHRVVVVTDPPVAGRSARSAPGTWQPSYSSTPTYASSGRLAPSIVATPAATTAAPAPAQVAPAPAPAAIPQPAPAPAAPTCSGSKCP